MRLSSTFSKRQALKTFLYVLIVTAAYLISTARGSVAVYWLPSVNALPYIIAALGFFEGPYMAGAMGVYGGMLISLSSSTVEGAEALIMGLFGIFCGTVGMTFMRRMLPSALVCGSLLLAGRGLISATYYAMFYSVSFVYVAAAYGKIILVSILPGTLGYLLVAAVKRRFHEE